MKFDKSKFSAKVSLRPKNFKKEKSIKTEGENKGFSFHNLKVGQKYAAAFILMILLFCISAVVNFIILGGVHNKMKEVQSTSNYSIKVTEMANVFEQKGSAITIYIANSDSKQATKFGLLTNQYKKLAEEIKPAIRTEQQEKLYKNINANEKKLTDLFDGKVVPAVKNQEKLNTMKSQKEAEITITKTVEDLAKLQKILKQESGKSIKSATSSLGSTIIILVVSIIASTLVGSAGIIFIGRVVNKQLGVLISASNEIADGKLDSEPLAYKSRDEIGLLSQSIEKMRHNLHSMIIEISVASKQVAEKSSDLKQSSHEVSSASQQIASTMTELSKGAEGQAHTSTSLVREMESYREKIEDANEEGRRINEASLSVLELTEQGNTLMTSSNDQMKKINDLMKSSVETVKGLELQTTQISKLVQVIREIADQTNLLALNAAIEAARAGEHGKGFAVVANEVRKLAEQVNHSVADITHIVQNVQMESNNVAQTLQAGYRQVDEGARQIELTGSTFGEIFNSVSGMAERVQGISKNLDSIARFTGEMNQSIESIASVSEEAAAGIEQTSATIQQTNSSMEEIFNHAESLAELSQKMSEMIGKFKL